MNEYAAITSLENLIASVAGSHESPAVKSDIALIGSALSILGQTILPRVNPSLNTSGIDAGLAKAFDGIRETVEATRSEAQSQVSPPVSAPPVSAPEGI